MISKKISVLGTVGIPAKYGGFETLVENLAIYHSKNSLPGFITVYCSSLNYPIRNKFFRNAKLKYIPLSANGVQSIFYDIVSLFLSVFYRSDVILLLGVSGAIALPFVRLFSSARVITNIDGMEWRRGKWKGFSRYFLRFSEKIAVLFSHIIISDNEAIAEYVRVTYNIESQVIAYGGDHALRVDKKPIEDFYLPERFALSICRIEPENNIRVILDAFSKNESCNLIVVGNWSYSEYGRELRSQYTNFKNISMLDPIYDLGKLKMLRENAFCYVHGHSAGGTNPSLVEAMHFGKPIYAYDCSFNRETTENKAIYFDSGSCLLNLISNLDSEQAVNVGHDMIEVAKRLYTWDVIGNKYFSLMLY